ncbi:MAG: 4-(cytidine 5'-diphospho)-2-C-methyl-D-erythritol kinase, partial [Planctomycetota bacterium]
MTRRVVRDAPAKLNLFLEVLFRRPDGYHELDSVFSAIDLHDTVEIEKASKIILEVEGSDVPADESNLAWRAARALGLGARIILRKRIPAGAGLG